MADINATNPVVVPAQNAITYDKWYLTQLVCQLSPTAGPTTVTLNRATNASGSWVLMPRGQGSSVTFNLDLLKEAQQVPEVASAMDAVTAAVVAYASSKNLL